ncbi:MAG: type I-E CRISPR-associated protein Cse1/CasA [Steroidobacteraceae bacterium]|nr:type I-E CRISPR-associated protein Cse1/CasA [Steroidobacteraceae bacterium]MBP7012747.1 type I-E CRISPR-associated protein Cse1/CasA [Steroidobacteraceae bacterium]
MNASSPTAPAFNLLDTPWLPVRMLGGQVTELGLLKLFEQASQIEGLIESSPPNLVALHRLLLAIAHRALTRSLGTWTDRDRARWYREGLPTDALVDYLHHWRERFWLFHPEHPFMQVAALATAEETRDKLKPWTQIALDSANGNTPVVFDHAVDTEPMEVCASVAVRSLLGFLQFTPGGLVQVFRSADKAGPLADTAAVIPVGSSLTEALALGLHPATDTADDSPPWERGLTTLAHLRADPTLARGICDRYTRLSRAVLLMPHTTAQSVSVRWLRFGAGLALAEDPSAPDPMASFRAGSNGLVRMTFHEGRAIWRDLGALLPDSTGIHAQPAAIVSWASNLHDARGEWDVAVPVLVAGLCSKKAKLVRWRSEHYALPSSALRSADVATALRSELKWAEELYYTVRGVASEMLAKAMPDSSSKDTRSRARAMLHAGPFPPAYFSKVEYNLPAMLDSVARNDLDMAHALWAAALVGASQSAWDAARGMLGQSAAALRAEATSYGKFQFAIKDFRMVAASGQTATMSAVPQEGSN